MPDAYQQGLHRLIAAWRPRLRSRLSWTRPGNWHLTLKFLGDVADQWLEQAVHSLDKDLGEGFIFQAGGGGFFPDLKRPRVVWAGVVQGGASCRGLAREVEQRLEGLGQNRERRPFSPHLTVARIKREKRDPWDELLRALHDVRWPETLMDRVVLWESRSTPKGPDYRVLKVFGLGRVSICSPRDQT